MAGAGGRRRTAKAIPADGAEPRPQKPADSVVELPRALRRYTPLYGAFVVGAVAALLAAALHSDLWIEAGAIGFFAVYLIVTLGRLGQLTPKHLRAHADESDTPGYVILVLAVVIVIAALTSLFLLLNAGAPDRLQVTLGVVALVLSWLGLHAMLAFHYAYEYYDTDMTSPPDKDGRRRHVGGLTFPGSELPDALSFLYFSFVVAMTAQVSDVMVTSNAMRRLVLLHGILAFFFNTVILAIAVNVVVSFGH